MSTRSFASSKLTEPHGALNSASLAPALVPALVPTSATAAAEWTLADSQSLPGKPRKKLIAMLLAWAALTALVCATSERLITATLIKIWDAAYGSHDDETLRGEPSPHMRAQDAHGLLARARANPTPQAMQAARAAVDWFVQHAAVSNAGASHTKLNAKLNDSAVWPCTYAYSYDTKPMWRSALTQAEIASLMLDAEEVFGDARYRSWALRALQPLFIDIADGGVRVTDGPQSWWYEEYADSSIAAPRVLNGMQYALLYLHSVWRRTGDPQAKLLFDNGLRAMNQHLADYDSGTWTFYDARGYLASPEYQNVHVKLLSQLYAVTGDPGIRRFQQKWQAYGGGFWKRFYSNLLLLRLNNSQIGVLGASAMMSLLVTLIGAWVWSRVRRDPALA